MAATLMTISNILLMWCDVYIHNFLTMLQAAAASWGCMSVVDRDGEVEQRFGQLPPWLPHLQQVSLFGVSRTVQWSVFVYAHFAATHVVINGSLTGVVSLGASLPKCILHTKYSLALPVLALPSY
jgi:hypothetical protein